MTSMTEKAVELLKQDKLGRVRTGRERREELLDEYEKSGMSGAEFAGYCGIKYPTFATWVAKRKREKLGGEASSAPVRWLEAEVGSKWEGSGSSGGLQVVLDCGARMEIGNGAAAQLAAEVLWALGRRGRC